MTEKEIHLLYFFAPHRATLVNDKHDLFGNGLNICRCKEVDKIAI